jgi:hypothetical protein
MLRRSACRHALQRPHREWVEERELTPVAGRDPDQASVRREADVVSEERRFDPAQQPRPKRVAHVHDRDPGRLRAERRPEALAIDRDMARGAADVEPADDPSTKDIHHEHLTGAGVGDKRVAAVRGGGRVARLTEAVDDVPDAS